MRARQESVVTSHFDGLREDSLEGTDAVQCMDSDSKGEFSREDFS